MKRQIRSNFYLDTQRLDALKALAAREETSVSDLVREGIDRVITDRLNNPKRDRDTLRANLQSFLARHAGAHLGLSQDDIDDLVVPKSRIAT
jgi:FixJ family two-component response regulator